ncbi:dihydroneopterin aldolase [Caballeronia sp. LZ029]|uniref:dihydroneopterin aldolase n=1 Tax=Caballeronia sp. LZ029 TaxID=3038564 RepID=UPI00286512DD|nr:dihydroneopterin aldolase [Caballeronia sp. LZ029]MDR5746685.1 dihydroneopterin aldolase [Caballeronia sp. LZ029]
MGRFEPIREAVYVAPQPAIADGRAGGAMDIVYIEGLTGQTVIGIDTSELHDPQPVRLSLAIGVPSIRACVTDRIEDTVNYAAVREAILSLLASHGLQLLEALAERIAQLVIADFGAHWVRVELAKPAKFDDVEAVGVVIERRRGVVDGRGGGGGGSVSLAWIGRGYVPG